MFFKVIKSLGSGGFGNVELVEDEWGQRFARKIFSVNQPLAWDLIDNVKKRFIREAKVQKGVMHRNIVPVLEEDLASDPPYFLMPPAEASLYHDIEQDRTLGGHWIRPVMDVIAGLEELHGLGMCHRDLKPQNVLRFRDGEGDFYAVGDFGFISLKDSRFSALTSTGMARGSDFYTAPEVVTDLRNASAQSDIFSLGCILHDLIGRQERVPCNEIREDGPFAGVLLSCTRQDPRRRFKSVRAVADALLSVEEDAGEFSTPQGEALGAALDGDGPVSADTWRQIVEYVEAKRPPAERRALLFKLTQQRILEVCEYHPTEANKLAVIYGRWVYESSFNFETCDTIAARALAFIENCLFDAKCPTQNRIGCIMLALT
jgi:eukaryotic-like serine/threonine-protein kinase